ncbi:MAG: hypothetical protein AB7I25_13695 [Vicinamibacterales bacterium]
MELAPDFDEFIASLNARGAEFLIVGAYALALHGAPRFTGDLDILVRPTPENGRRVLDAIRDFGFPIEHLSPERIVDARTLLQMGEEPIQIHVMSAISGVSWDEAWADREMGPCGSQQAAYLGRASLLRNKRAAGRPKDLADIDALKESGD